MFNWLRQLRNRTTNSTRGGSQPIRRKVSRTPLHLEALEDRTLLTVNYLGLANGLLSELQAIQGQLDTVVYAGSQLPFVGNRVREVGNVVDRFAGRMHDTIAALNPASTAGQVRDALFQVLGPNVGLNVLGNRDGNPAVTPEDIQVALTGDSVQVSLNLTAQPININLPADFRFNTGLPGLPFRVDQDGGLQAQVGFDYKDLVFGYNGGGFYLNTATPDELAVHARVQFAPHTQLGATVGFLKATLGDGSDQDANLHSALDLTFKVDVGGPSMVRFDGLDGKADVYLLAKAEFAEGTPNAFPSISTDFEMHWGFGTQGPATPTVAFKNVQVGLGTFLSSVVEPVVSNLQSVLNTFQPVFDVFNARIPGISDLANAVGLSDVTLRSLSDLVPTDPSVSAILGAVKTLSDINGLVHQLHAADGSHVSFVLGDFNLGGNQNGEQTPGDLRTLGALDLDAAASNLGQDLSSLAPQAGAFNLSGALGQLPGGLQGAAQQLLTAFGQTPNGFHVGFDFPVITNPAASVFKFLLGEDAPLATFDAGLHFNSQMGGPSLGVFGLSVGFEGAVVVDARVKVGYDTHGLRKFLQSQAPADLLDGFYVDSNPVTGTHLSLGGNIGAVLTAGAVFFKLELHGGIFTPAPDPEHHVGPIEITLKDPDQNGRLRFSELAAFPLQLSGQLYAGITFEVKVGVEVFGSFVGFSKDFTIAQVELLNFNKPPTVPVIAGEDAQGNLTLYVGQNAGSRQGVNQVDGGQQFIVRHLAYYPDPLQVIGLHTPGLGEVIEVEAFGVTNRFFGVTSISAMGGAADLNIDIKPGVMAAADLRGGTGHANLTYSGTGTAHLTAGALGGVLIGGEGTNTLDGGPGDDELVAGPGLNIIHGQGGRNTVTVQLPSVGGFLTGGSDPSANTLEILGMPAGGTIGITGAGGAAVLDLRDANGARVFTGVTGSFGHLIIGGGGAHNVTINDLSGGSLQDVFLDVNRHRTVNGVDVLDAAPSTVTILGSAFHDNLDVSASTHSGVSTATVHNYTPGHNSTTLLIYGLEAQDHLVVDGGQGDDTYNMHLDPSMAFTTTIRDSGTTSTDPAKAVKNLLKVDGPGFGASGVEVTDASVVFSYLQTSGGLAHWVTGTINVDSNVQELEVTSPAGGSTISIDQPTSHVKTTVYGSSGVDTFLVNSATNLTLDGLTGDDQYQLNFDASSSLSENITVDDTGADGGNTVTVNDQNNSHNGGTTYKVWSDHLRRSGLDNLGDPLGTGQGLLLLSTRNLNYQGVNTVVLNTGKGTNTIDVYSIQGQTTINTGEGISTVNVAPQSHNLEQLGLVYSNDSLTVNGGTGASTLVVNDQANPYLTASGNLYEVTANTVGRPLTFFDLLSGAPLAVYNPIHYSQIGTLILHTGAGDDAIDVGGASQLLDGIATTVSIDGGGGRNTLTLNDQANGDRSNPFFGRRYHPHDTTYTLGEASVTRSNLVEEFSTRIPGLRFRTASYTATVAYQNVQELAVNGGSVGSTFNVGSTNTRAPMTIQGGSGNDTFTVGGLDSRLDSLGATLTIDGGGGTDTLTLNDQGNPADRTRNHGLELIHSQPQYTVTATAVTRLNRQSVTTLATGQVQPLGNTGTHAVNYSHLEVLTLNGGSTGNVFNVEGTGAATTINTGDGSNTVAVCPQGQNLDTLNFALTVQGGTGVNSLTVNDQANAYYVLKPHSNEYTITADQVARPQTMNIASSVNGVVEYVPVARPVNYSGITSLVVNAGQKGNRIAVPGTHAGTTTTVNAGGGSDTINVGNEANTLDLILGPLTVNGRSGTNTLNVNDQGEAGAQSYTMTATTVARSGAALITYGTIQSVVINAGVGVGSGNYVTVSGTAAGSTATVNAGPRDTITVGNLQNRLDDVHGAVTVHGQGNNNLNVNDEGSTVGHTYTLTGSYLDRTGAGRITYSGVVGLQFGGGGGDDTYNLQGIALNAIVAVWAGGGNDTFALSPTARNLDNLQGILVIHGAGPGPTTGSATLTVNDQANSLAETWEVTGNTVVRDRYDGAVRVLTQLYFDSVSRLVLNAGSASDTVNVRGTASGTDTTVNSSGGDDTINVGNAATVLDDLRGPLTVNGQGGKDTLNLNDRGNHTGYVFEVAANQVRRKDRTAAGNLTMAPVSFNTVEELVVNGGGGDNLFNLYGSAAGTRVTVNAGLGFDGGWALTDNPFLGPVSFHDEGFPGYFYVYDYLNPAAQTWTMSAGRVDRSGMASITYDGVSATGVYTSRQPGDTVNVLSTVAGAGTVVSLYGTGDRVTVGSVVPGLGRTLSNILGPLNIATESASDVILDDSADQTARQATFFNDGYSYGVHGLSPAPIYQFNGVVPGATVRVLGGRGDDTFAVRSNSPAALTLDGGQGTDTLTGPDADSTWALTSANAGTVGAVAFAGFENLTGGSANDTFALKPGGRLSGTIDGGTGKDTVDYSVYAGNVVVNLALGTATAVGQGVRGVENATGGSGTSILVGDANANVLRGGTGRNLIVGGTGADQLLGGADEDVLLAGSTAYDTNAAALTAVMAEWGRLDLPYATRVAHLTGGGGRNGASLLTGTTFHSNGSGNALTGDAGLDLFFGSKALDQSDWHPEQGEKFIEDKTHPSTGVDARGLSLPNLLLDGVTSFDKSASRLFALTPGTHTVTGAGSVGGMVTFTVAADGTVSYDPALEGVLAGRGTSTLTIRGVTVTVNATALSVGNLLIDSQLSVQTGTPIVLMVLPGRQYLSDLAQLNPPVYFTVAADGKVGYDPTLQGVLTGGGTGTLTVRGVTVTVNATALSVGNLLIDSQLSARTAAPIVLTVLPGRQYLSDLAQLNPPMYFTVNADSTVSFDSLLQGILTGQGTSTLTLRGVTVTVDATALSVSNLLIDSQLSVQTVTPIVLTVLPGRQYLSDLAQLNPPVYFTVNANGTVSYDPSQEGALTGLGTSTLTVHGIL